jgi:hypothetical protein
VYRDLRGRVCPTGADAIYAATAAQTRGNPHIAYDACKKAMNEIAEFALQHCGPDHINGIVIHAGDVLGERH